MYSDTVELGFGTSHWARAPTHGLGMALTLDPLAGAHIGGQKSSQEDPSTRGNGRVDSDLMAGITAPMVPPGTPGRTAGVPVLTGQGIPLRSASHPGGRIGADPLGGASSGSAQRAGVHYAPGRVDNHGASYIEFLKGEQRRQRDLVREQVRFYMPACPGACGYPLTRTAHRWSPCWVARRAMRRSSCLRTSASSQPTPPSLPPL
jgi:hypothetical protein